MRTCLKSFLCTPVLLFATAFPALAQTEWGNTISSRTNATDSATTVFFSNFYAAPTDGTVSSIQLFDQGNSGSFQIFQLRPTANLHEYNVVASSQTISPTGTNAPLTVNLNNPFNIQTGDILGHYGNGIPFSINSTAAAAHNNQTIYYSSPAAPAGTITLGSASFPQFNQFRDYAWAADHSATFETVGNGAGQGNTGPDTATSLLIAMENDPFTTSGQLRTWQFFNDTTASAGNDITPVILRDIGGGTLEVTGVGATRVGTADGIQQHLFDLVDGSDLVVPGDIFGFYYGDNTGGNAGSVEYLDLGGGSPLQVRLFSDANGINLADQFSVPAFTLGRFYSANATAFQLVPEPTSVAIWSLLAAVFVCFCVRRCGKAKT